VAFRRLLSAADAEVVAARPVRSRNWRRAHPPRRTAYLVRLSGQASF
jgi:hypothetical protein